MAPAGSSRDETRAYGRRAFLGVSAVGLSSLLWGRPVWQALSGVAQPLTSALPAGVVAPGGWGVLTGGGRLARDGAGRWGVGVGGVVGGPPSVCIAAVGGLPRGGAGS